MQFDTYPRLGLGKEVWLALEWRKASEQTAFLLVCAEHRRGSNGESKAFSSREAGVNCHADKIDL